MPPPPKTRLKRIGFKLALVAATLLLCACLLEVGVRLFYKPSVFRIDRKHYQPEPWPYAFRFFPDQTIFVPIPELEGGGMQVTLNHHGFRGPDIDEIATHRVRIASIGDSFTFGWGMKDFNDQCVVGFVNEYALHHPGVDVGLAVVAEPGWGTSDYLFAYLDYARKMKPDLVILGFFCGDDLVTRGTIDAIGSGPPPDKPWAQTKSSFHLATLDWARAMVRGSPNLTKLALGLGVRPSGDLMRFLRSEPEPMPAMWAETLALLTTLNEQIRKDGGQLAIISYPSLIQVFAHAQLDDDRFDYRHIDAKLKDFCGANGIIFVPFLDTLIADGKLDLYLAKDRHLTRRGQRLCRDVLIEKLSPVLDEIVARRNAGETPRPSVR